MTANRGLFVRQTGTAPSAVGTTPIEARLALAGLLAETSPGVPRSGVLYQSATSLVTGAANMSYNIGPAQFAINRATNEGVYIVTLTGTTNVGTTSAPGTGSRWDLVYVKQNDPDKGDANNLPVVGVVQGTSSTGTPTKPTGSVPAGGYVIAECQIFSGTSATNAAPNTIAQVWRHTATRGAPIPVRNSTELAEITAPPLKQMVSRLDNASVLSWNGTVWTEINGARYVFWNADPNDSTGEATLTFTPFPSGVLVAQITDATFSVSDMVLYKIVNLTNGSLTARTYYGSNGTGIRPFPFTAHVTIFGT